jgi:2-haloacid dehalogenase
VITADDVETLVFDVLGTVVDEAGSMRADLAVALNQADAGQQADTPDQAGAAQQVEALSAAWARRFGTLVSAIGEGAPWRSTDDLNAEALADVLRDGPQLPEATVRQLGLAGHRLTRRPRWLASLGASPSWHCRTATCRC